jgi:purine-nucleoside phosphorylase
LFSELGVRSDAAAAIAAGLPKPRVAIVAGSGLGGLADTVGSPASVSYDDLPEAPRVGGVVGHGGRLVGGTIAGVPVAVFAGRVHLYQGVSALDAAWPARVSGALGAEVLIVTNAAGGVSQELDAGDLVLLSDHVNLAARNPLEGWTGPVGGTPFVAMAGAYDAELRGLAHGVAEMQGLDLKDGVYAWQTGPTYETAAEVGMVARLGGDVVGMSTVPEVIVARALGLRVLGISLVTNVAGGHHDSHDEVLATAARAAERLQALVIGILGRL